MLCLSFNHINIHGNNSFSFKPTDNSYPGGSQQPKTPKNSCNTNIGMAFILFHPLFLRWCLHRKWIGIIVKKRRRRDFHFVPFHSLAALLFWTRSIDRVAQYLTTPTTIMFYPSRHQFWPSLLIQDTTAFSMPLTKGYHNFVSLHRKSKCGETPVPLFPSHQLTSVYHSSLCVSCLELYLWIVMTAPEQLTGFVLPFPAWQFNFYVGVKLPLLHISNGKWLDSPRVFY